MEFPVSHDIRAGTSPPSSSSSLSSSHLPNPNPNSATTNNNNDDPMHSWWKSVSKARSRIQQLSTIIPSSCSLSTLADSDRPARSLLESSDSYSAISSALSSPDAGSGTDPLCNWLYDTFLSSDPDLRLVVLSFIPLISGLYLSRVISSSSSSASNSPSLAGFEAVLLAIYAAETKLRGGKPVLISIPDLSQPSLYHSPRNKVGSNAARVSVGVLSAPLEPQIAMKSTKRACIVGVALDCYYKVISQMPSWSKLDFCLFASAWAGQECPCRTEFDEIETVIDSFSEIEDVGREMGKLVIEESGLDSRGSRIPLPWELMQPVLRILGHCLLGPLNSDDVKDAASVAVRCLYARASHDLVPQAILSTRSLIQLDKRARDATKMAAANAASSNANTPSKAKKPEVLLVSK